MAVPVNEIVKITNRNSGKVLEVQEGRLDERGVIDQYTDNAKDHQRWKLALVGRDNGNDVYIIENLRSHKVLKVKRQDGISAEILQETYEPGAVHQQWKLYPVAEKPNVYKIANRESRKVLDVPEGSPADAVAIKQYPPWEPPDARQEWELTPSMTTTVAPKLRGPLHAWGYNSEGQLGDGTNSEQLEPKKMPYLTRVGIKAISTGASHSLALLEDHTVQAWGSQDYYQLGNPTYADRLEPGAVVDLKGVRAISAGGWHNLALLEDGTVRTWGLDNEGQLGDGTASGNEYQPPAKVLSLERVVAISAGGRHSLALLEDGTVWAWGSQDWYQLGNPTYVDLPSPKKVLELGEVKAIAAGPWHSLALLKDGTVRGWGANNYGQLGGGTTTGNQYQPPVMALELGGVEAIAVGSNHSLALLNNGTVWAWGYNGHGQLGDGTKTDRHRPVQVSDLDGVEAIAAGRLQEGSYHSLALRKDGTVWAWGYNGYGQLGDGTKEPRDKPVKVLKLKEVKAIDAGGYHSLAAS